MDDLKKTIGLGHGIGVIDIFYIWGEMLLVGLHTHLILKHVKQSADTSGIPDTSVMLTVTLKSSSTQSQSHVSVSPEPVDREYQEYNNPKTVFFAEACDDLGGEF
ncbi:unnamed protein product [Microthlaspi erraticum]|uniref:Uncharacterized protein n=1 Tax=Microthlaspi erraticum TaxID=1685480 RepID=A0A6D2J5Q8_9BRAS|nr:unnamed protein product [Microthlaspi erraticum]